MFLIIKSVQAKRGPLFKVKIKNLIGKYNVKLVKLHSYYEVV